MSTVATPPDRHRSNPFATRHTRPGAVPPLDQAGAPVDLGSLVDAVERHGRVAIVGPHGTGKSTLLAGLAGRLTAAGRGVELLRVHRRRDLFRLLAALRRGPADAVLLVDGWEKLGRPGAALAAAAARLAGRRLVVTSHAATWFPVAWSTGGTLPLLTAIVARLPAHTVVITPADLAESFALSGGNLRDALGDLYDRFELRSRRS